jgi:hypothetical protein
MRTNARFVSMAAGLALAAVVIACTRQTPAPAPPAVVPSPVPSFVPDLGAEMMLQQMRHTKLWLAGSTKNWPLAAFEVQALTDGFDEIVALHPTWKDAPVAPKDAIPIMVKPQLDDVKAAVDKKDPAAFATAYDALTAGCNGCHQATNYPFLVVQRPGAGVFPDQVFAPGKG